MKSALLAQFPPMRWSTCCNKYLPKVDDTDTAMIREGVATLTALGGVAEVWVVPPAGPADAADVPDGGVTGPTGGLFVEAHPVPGDELSPAHLFPDPEIAEHLHPRRFD